MNFARLPLRADYPAALAANAQQLPIFMGHGDSDPVVPLQWAQVSHRAMIKEQTKGEEQEEAKPSPWSGALGLEKVHCITANSQTNTNISAYTKRSSAEQTYDLCTSIHSRCISGDLQGVPGYGPQCLRRGTRTCRRFPQQGPSISGV